MSYINLQEMICWGSPGQLVLLRMDDMFSRAVGSNLLYCWRERYRKADEKRIHLDSKAARPLLRLHALVG